MSRVQCVICKKPVKLEDSKCNEFGQAVHEDCYVRMLTEKNQPLVSLSHCAEAFSDNPLGFTSVFLLDMLTPLF
jgi:hypothetical protein